ncbi:MAG: salicylate synthase [Actinomycetota bacterium]
MSFTADVQAAAIPAVTGVQAAKICAAWAGSGRFGDHVVYEHADRWSFGGGRKASVRLTTSELVVERDGVEVRTPWDGDPSAALGAALDAIDEDGWRLYGWVGFDFAAAQHGLLDRVPPGTTLAHLVIPEFEATVGVAGIDVGTAPPETAALLRTLADEVEPLATPCPISVHLDPYGYEDMVATAVGEIERGDYRKVILSRVVEVPFAVDLPRTYALGRARNNPARSYLFQLDDLSAVGFSPELVLAVDADRIVQTEPLAGTRALGIGAAADAEARRELQSDVKEIAEHAMSVRACWEEVESVSRPGTTAVSEYMVVKDRGSVQHLASTVRGRLADDLNPWHSFAVAFPSITASGIPKTEALEAIYRLEPLRRNLYSGAVVTASSAGDLEAALVLRTVFSSGGRTWLRAGAGIVEQSRPSREFDETCEKLGSIAPFLVPAR